MWFEKFNTTYMAEESGGDGGGGGDPTPVVPTGEEPAAIPEPKPDEKPEATPKKEEPEDGKLPEKEVDKSTLGQVTGLIEKAGLDMQDVAKYAKANDGKVDLETMVALQEKHGDAVASLIADQIKSIHTVQSKATTERENAVFDQVKEAFADITSDPEQTGESMWTELATWSKDNVSNEHRNEINKLLGQGGLAAKLAVQELTNAFKESLGTQEFQDADLLTGESLTPQSGGGELTSREYNTELNKLTKNGHQYGESREIAALDARRMKSRKRGIK